MDSRADNSTHNRLIGVTDIPVLAERTSFEVNSAGHGRHGEYVYRREIDQDVRDKSLVSGVGELVSC